MAKWPGSVLYFHAKINSIDDEEGIAVVLFADGTEMEVPTKHIKVFVIFVSNQLN